MTASKRAIVRESAEGPTARAGAALAAGPRQRARAHRVSPRGDLIAGLGSKSAFSGVRADTLARIVETSPILRAPAGRVIFRKGDAPGACYLILEGAVKVSLPGRNGQEMLLAVLGKGDVVGEMALLDRLPRSATVTALKGCELCQLTAATFEWLAQADIAVYRQLLRVLSTRLRAGNESNAAQQMPLSVRLARAFMQLAQSFGERLPDGRILIRQKLSQAELGRMVGAARENVNRQLNDWCRAKLLARISGYYCLERPQAFGPLADHDGSG